jgi:hypothetical protein
MKGHRAHLWVLSLAGTLKCHARKQRHCCELAWRGMRAFAAQARLRRSRFRV